MEDHTPTALEPRQLPEAPASPPASTKPPSEPPRKRTGLVWFFVILLVLAAAAAYYYWPKQQPNQTDTAQSGGKGTGKGRGGGGGATPVVATRAKKGDIGVYYTGLGAVTPIYTVTVKSRVDGQLMTVAFKEGQMVHVGDTLVEIDRRPYEAALKQAEGNVLKDQAMLKNAHIDLERYRVLLSQQAIPEQTFATQEATVGQIEGTLEADQGILDNAKVNLQYTHITAPITGLVGLRLVDPGNIIHASDSSGIAVITQVDPISVIFTMPEDQLQPVLQKNRAGQHLSVEAWDREMKNKIAQGILQTIDNQIDPTTGTLKLRADFENKSNRLFPSQFVNARLLVEEKRGVTLLPNAAIQRNTQSTFVWLVNKDNSVSIRTITVGTTEGDQSEIKDGLQPGEVVVMVGVDRLQNGSKVNARIDGETPPPDSQQQPQQQQKQRKGKS